MKLIVPQELQQQIIDLYVNKEMTRKKIIEELRLPFEDSVVKRILVENNIPIRTNNGAQKGGRKKIEVDKEVQDKIIELYQKGYGLERIVKELNLPFSFDKVKSILDDNNIHLRGVKESRQVQIFPDLRKYSINDNYNLESHNGAWLLGFIAADGYLPNTKGAKNRIVITLAKKDKEILERIKEELSYTGPIHEYMMGPGNSHEAVSLAFTSKEIRQKIEQYGIVNNKTFKLDKIPDLPQDYLIDFIAGFFDGDGSVFYKNEHGIAMNITCASYNFIKEIRDYLHKEYKVNNVTIHSQQRENIVYSINYGKRDSLILGKIFYENDYLRLGRKRNKYFSLKNS